SAAASSRSALRRSPAWRNVHPLDSLAAATLPASDGGTVGRMKSGNFGAVTAGAGASFGAHALRRTATTSSHRRIAVILSRRAMAAGAESAARPADPEPRSRKAARQPARRYV